MQMLSRVVGIAAMLLVAVAAVTFMVFPQFPKLVDATWVAAGVLMVVWVVLSRQLVTSFFLKKSTRYGANLAFIVFLVSGITVFFNILGKDHHWRKDVTRSGINSLSLQTIKILQDLKQEVKVYYFSSTGEKEKNEVLFHNYQYYSKFFKYEFVDLARRPTFAEAMGVKRLDTVVFTLPDSKKTVKIDGVGEEKLTNGLIKILSSKDQTIGFLVGHGERSVSASDPMGFSVFKDELGKQGYTTKEINIMNEGKISDGTSVLVIAGPHSSFFPKELEILSAWINKGGHVFFALDVDVAEAGLTKGAQQMAELLKKMGILVENKILVDPTSKAANVEPSVLLGFAASKEHVITKDFPSSRMGLVANFYFPLTTYLGNAGFPNMYVTPLAKTSQAAWAVSDWSSFKRGVVSFNKGTDHTGEMDLAYAIEVRKPRAPPVTPNKLDEPAPVVDVENRLAVFATSIVGANGMIDKAGNRDLLLNTMAWLANDEKLISIRPKDEGANDKINVNGGLMGVVFLVTVVLLPLLMLIAAVMVWLRRRRQ